jgi:2-polyprenyl-3-methyl-5-hydroxy-6-metoxy-1,4-benzoquinol methylase
MSAFQKTYDAEQARRYQELKKPGKHRAEMQLVRRAFADIPRTERVLDVPCGYGRVMQELHALGFETSGADLSEPMLELARANLARCGWSGALERQDLQALRYPDRAFDALVCFRVFHHFPDAATRRSVVGELCRVARTHVLLSYLDPDSFTARLERLRGRRSARHYTPLAELAGYFEPCGFRLARDHARLALLHSLHLSVWERAR